MRKRLLSQTVEGEGLDDGRSPKAVRLELPGPDPGPGEGGEMETSVETGMGTGEEAISGLTIVRLSTPPMPDGMEFDGLGPF